MDDFDLIYISTFKLCVFLILFGFQLFYLFLKSQLKYKDKKETKK